MRAEVEAAGVHRRAPGSRRGRPPCSSVNGSSRKKMPMVLRTNCTMSVSVIDHMPPIDEYSMTIAPPMIDRHRAVDVEQHVEDRGVGDGRGDRQHQRVGPMTIPDADVASTP